jgi:hypothetical protein
MQRSQCISQSGISQYRDMKEWKYVKSVISYVKVELYTEVEWVSTADAILYSSK